MLTQVRLERAAVCIAQAACTNHPVRDAALGQVCSSDRVPPERVPIQRAGRVQDELLLKGQSVPPPLSLSWRRRRPGMVAWSRCGCPCQPGARLSESGEVFTQLNEIKDVATRFAAEAHEPLALHIYEETGSSLSMERTQALKPMRP